MARMLAPAEAFDVRIVDRDDPGIKAKVEADGDVQVTGSGGGGGGPVDVSDRVGRLLGIVTAPSLGQETTLATRASESTLLTRATEATLALLKNRADLLLSEAKGDLLLARLDDILAAAQAIAIDADTIAIDADTINLSTDQLEALITAVRDRLPGSLHADGGLKSHLQNPLDVLTRWRDENAAADRTVSELYPLPVSDPAIAQIVNNTSDVEDLLNGIYEELVTIEQSDLGAPTDPEATGNGSLIAILKRIRTLLAPLNVNLDTRASETTLAQMRDDMARKWDEVEPTPTTISTLGENTIYTPPSGQRAQLCWWNVQADAGISGYVLVKVKLAGASATGEIWRGQLKAAQPMMRTREYVGDVDAPVVVELDSNKSVHVNLETRVV
jgi:hypothetical protein